MKKHYFVAWECGMDALDDCALQGPHTKERAEEIKKDLHSAGLKASVIDCSKTFEALERGIAQ